MAALGAGRVWEIRPLCEDGDDARGYLVGVVLVDDTDVLAVWEPEEAEVFGFLQVAVQVVKNLTSAEGRREDCVGHRMTVGSTGRQGLEWASVSPHQKEMLKIFLTLPNGVERLIILLGIKTVYFHTDFPE